MSRTSSSSIIKVMLDGSYLRGGDRAWCVAAGDVPKPTRGCLWRALAFFASVDSATRHYNKLDPTLGRALLDLENPRLRFVSPAGRLLACIEVEAKLLS